MAADEAGAARDGSNWAVLLLLRFFLAMVMLLGYSDYYVGGPHDWTVIGLILDQGSAVFGFFILSGYSIADASEPQAGIAATLAHEGPILCDIHVTPNESLWPKAIAVPQADGMLLSMPLEDMTPLLSREELRAQMLVPLTEESERVVV